MTTPHPEPLYRDWRHCDLQNDHLTEDSDYFRRQVQQWGGPVLELACGTGRIAIPLAPDGHRVAGLDLSETMLAGARRKAAEAGVAESNVWHERCAEYTASPSPFPKTSPPRPVRR